MAQTVPERPQQELATLPVYAFINYGNARTPAPVTLEFDDDGLEITDAKGDISRFAYQWLTIREDRGGSIVIGRKWSPNFRLHVNGEAARAAREALRPVSWKRRFTRLAFQSPKAAMLVLAMPFFVIDSLPGAWVARATPLFMSRGIEATAIDQIANQACTDRAGNAAIQSIVSILAPEASRIIVTNDHTFEVSARPGGELIIHRPATTEIESEVLAALLAHALAHQQAGDVPTAVGRGEESNYVGRLTFFRFSRDPVKMVFTREEEAEADLTAIAMLTKAGIALGPAARFFAQINEAKLETRYWAQEYAESHPGLKMRMTSWSAAASAQHSHRQLLDERQSDDLFNVCWERPEGAPTKWPSEEPLEGSAQAR